MGDFRKIWVAFWVLATLSNFGGIASISFLALISPFLSDIFINREANETNLYKKEIISSNLVKDSQYELPNFSEDLPYFFRTKEVFSSIKQDHESDNENQEPVNWDFDNILRLKNMPYMEYMKTTHWDEIRKQKLSEAGYECERCGASGIPLDVHHLHYATRGEEDMDDLQALCRPCHNIADEERKELEREQKRNNSF